VHAVHAARDTGMTVWALTGPCPNPLADLADDTVSVDTARAAVVLEVHQLAVHLVCEAIDCALPRAARRPVIPRRACRRRASGRTPSTGV
jgi:DNA-binding MurR/RpiR family transcriptional regulator